MLMKPAKEVVDAQGGGVKSLNSNI